MKQVAVVLQSCLVISVFFSRVSNTIALKSSKMSYYLKSGGNRRVTILLMYLLSYSDLVTVFVVVLQLF